MEPTTTSSKQTETSMHRRRGIVRASITRLATRLSEYEGKTDKRQTKESNDLRQHS